MTAGCSARKGWYRPDPRARGTPQVTAEPESDRRLQAGAVDPARAAVPVIATTALTRRFGPAITALDDLTMAGRGGLTRLVGADRAGQATLVKILLWPLP